MILSAHYWPKEFNPLRQGALVIGLTQEGEWHTVRGYDGSTWLAHRDELEVLAQEEE